MLLQLKTGEIADGGYEHKMKKIALLFVLLFLIAVVAVEAKVIDLEVKPEKPVKGQEVTIQGRAEPGENVKIIISFKKDVQVENGEYTFSVENVNIPEGKNGVTITVRGCTDLKVSSTKVSSTNSAERYPHWVTFGSEASGEVAERLQAERLQAEISQAKISEANIAAGVYDVLIHGTSKKKSVKIAITAEGYERADKKGNFRHRCRTDSMPLGKFTVQAGKETKNVHLSSPTSNTPARITQKINRDLELSQLRFIFNLDFWNYIN
jgi:hypothetical protein